jgi:methionyl aminopeptidase
MTIETQQDLEKLRAVGRVVAEARRRMAGALRAGVTTGELDEIGRGCLEEFGARSAPEATYGFPGATCISVNDEAAHGVPSERVIADGDLVNIDVSAELDGYYADTGASFPVGNVDRRGLQLCRFGRRALAAALGQVRSGGRFRELGRAVDRVARGGGFSVVADLGGHGLGRGLHEAPEFIPFGRSNDRRRFHKGLVVAIEPFLSDGATGVWEESDGWTLRTRGGRRAVQFEHTVVVTDGKPIVLTR